MCVMSVITNRTKKMKNSSLAIPAAATAIPAKPKIAAMIATIKKIRDQYNICTSLKKLLNFTSA